MEQRSAWVPAELAPFSSQHHKWSWSRPERSTVRLPLCADSIRNNCILASLHSSPFTTIVWHFTVFLSCKLQYRPRAGEGHCSIAAIVFLFFFFDIHIPLDWMESCTDEILNLHSYEKEFRSNTWLWGFVVFIYREQHTPSAHLTSLPAKLALETWTVQWLSLTSNSHFFTWCNTSFISISSHVMSMLKKWSYKTDR